MGVEAEKPSKSTKSTEATKPIGVFAANRRFERFLGIDSNALREDQGGSYYPFEQEEFRRQREPVEIDPEDGKLIATITYDLENKKVIVQRVGEPPIEM